jgi:hypothetical protein
LEAEIKMGSSSSQFDILRDKCSQLSKTLNQMKHSTKNADKRKSLERDYATQLRLCRSEIDMLLRLGLSTEKNTNLRELQVTLSSDDFTDLFDESLGVKEINDKLNIAMSSIKKVSNSIESHIGLCF